MRTINQIQLVAQVKQAPQINRQDEQMPMATVLAVTNELHAKNNGADIIDTTWHRLVFYGPLVDSAEQQITPGISLFVQGTLKNQSWQDKSGKPQSTAFVRVDNYYCIHGE